MRHLLSLVAIYTLGCADMSLNTRADDWGMEGAADTGSAASYLDLAALEIRLDVRPGGSLEMEPQSFFIDQAPDTGDLLLELSPSIDLTGRVTGFDATPYAEPTVPGTEEIPVSGRVHARIPGTLADNSTTSSIEDGEYALRIPAGVGYELAVIPIDPPTLPFGVWADESLLESTETEFSLGYGYPIYGVVEQSDDTRLPSTGQLYLIDPDTGFEGPRADTEVNGHYLLRAYPGDYTLIFEGDDASYLPRIETPITLSGEYGVRQDLDVGILSPIEVQGRILDHEGDGVKDAMIRFTSLSLDQAIGQATVETETDQAGLFSRALLPGIWYAQFIPPYQSDGSSSPEEMQIEVLGTSAVDIGDVYLSDRVLLEGQVVGPGGEPVQDVGISAIEQSFNGYSYSASTNGDGFFSIEVPDVAMRLSLQPSSTEYAITHVDLTDPAMAPSQLQLGGGTLLAGQIVSDEGGASYTMIEVRDRDNVLYGATLTDIDGYFEVRVGEQ